MCIVIDDMSQIPMEARKREREAEELVNITIEREHKQNQWRDNDFKKSNYNIYYMQNAMHISMEEMENSRDKQQQQQQPMHNNACYSWKTDFV